MTSRDLIQDHIADIEKLFPNCIREIRDPRGGVTHAVDFDALKQELSGTLIEGRPERYEFNWPGKRAAALLANTPIQATLRPCREESVNFDTTENLYIEGDNLDVLKLLCDNYRGKVKMIYIDPPYNTGNDFIYEDDFAQSGEDYRAISGDYDDQGNRLAKNTTASGRFHTDWLNMMYPRLKIAQKLLSDDGVIFISIDDGEYSRIKILCDDIFGANNFRNNILARRRIKSLNSQFSAKGLYSLNIAFEYILVYSKSNQFLMKALRQKKEVVPEKGRWDVFWSNADRPTMRYDILGFTPSTGQWRNSKEKAYIAVKNYIEFQQKYESNMTLEEYYEKTGIHDFVRRIPDATGKNGGVQHWVPPSDTFLRTSNWADIEVSQIGKEIDLPFDNPKSKQLLMELIRLAGLRNNEIILDFFSGSGTTAHAVMQLNAEDGGHRKFIMVQLPEACEDGSEAAKAGFRNICEIGKERIRRAGAKIAAENATSAPNLDIGFRVLKLDSSNMTDVYYTPEDLRQEDLFAQVDNVKPDRTAEDLLFQVMLEKDIPLSSKIETSTVAGKTLYNVADGYLLACFDTGVTDEVVTAIAKMQPVHAVFRDAGMASDSTAINFEQIFAAYSPDTRRAIL